MNIYDSPSKNSRFILAFMQNLPVGLLIFDDKARVIAANQAIEKTLDYYTGAKGKGIGKVLGCIQTISSYNNCGKGEQCRQCQLRNLMAKISRTEQTVTENVTLELLIDGFFKNVTIRLCIKTFTFERKRYFMMVIPDTAPLNPEPDSYNNDSFHGIIGRDFKMQKFYDAIRKVATTDTSVFIQGESGTGKELVARAIHKESHRCKAPFVPLNCGAMISVLSLRNYSAMKKGLLRVPYMVKKGASSWLAAALFS